MRTSASAVDGQYIRALTPDTSYPNSQVAESEPRQATWSRRHRAGHTLAAMALAAVPLFGAHYGSTVPTDHIEFSNGINGGVAAVWQDSSVLHTNGGNILELPDSHTHMPLLGDVGIKVTFDPVTVDGKQKRLSEYASLIAYDGTAIKQTALPAILKRAGEGAAVGLLANTAALAGFAAMKRRREGNRTKPKHNSLPKKIGAVAALAVVATNIGAGASASELPFNQDQARITLISPSLAKYAPILENAKLHGTGRLGDTIASTVKYKQDVDTYWRNIRQQTVKQFDQLRMKGQMPWEKDPNKVAILSMSDMHGNFPLLDNLSHIIKASGANIITNSGDQMNTSGDLPFDNLSMQLLVKSVQPNRLDGRRVPIVFVSGNHDSFKLPADIVNTRYTDGNGQKFHPLIALTEKNGYKTHIDGLDFVGGPDATRTSSTSTLPLSDRAQKTNSALLGQKLRSVACAVKSQTGKPPVVVTHEPNAAYPVLVAPPPNRPKSSSNQYQSCAGLTISGHTHKVSNPRYFQNSADDGYTIQENLGSATGASSHQHLADIYNRVIKERGGNMILNIEDKHTGLVTNYVTIRFMPDGKVHIKNHQVGAATHYSSPLEIPRIDQFLVSQGLMPRHITLDTELSLSPVSGWLQPVTQH